MGIFRLGTTDEDQTAALALGMLDLPQHQRDSSLDSFAKGKKHILVKAWKYLG